MKHRSCGWNDDFLMEVLTGGMVECALAPATSDRAGRKIPVNSKTCQNNF